MVPFSLSLGHIGCLSGCWQLICNLLQAQGPSALTASKKSRRSILFLVLGSFPLQSTVNKAGKAGLGFLFGCCFCTWQSATSWSFSLMAPQSRTRPHAEHKIHKASFFELNEFWLLLVKRGAEFPVFPFRQMRQRMQGPCGQSVPVNHVGMLCFGKAGASLSTQLPQSCKQHKADLPETSLSPLLIPHDRQRPTDYQPQ